MGVVVQFVSVLTFTAWGLYLWADVKEYGNHPECNDRIKYVVFFFTVRATAPWLRGLWIAGIVLSAVGLMLYFGWKAMELFEMKRMAEEQQTEEIGTTACEGETPTRTLTPGTPSHAQTAAAGKEWYFDISFTLLLCVAPLPYLIVDAYESPLSSAIYSTVMLELTVSGRICHISHTIH